MSSDCCRHGCHRERTSHARTLAGLEFLNSAASQYTEAQVSRIIQVPSEMELVYRDMVQRVQGLSRPPKLLFCDTVHGAVGLFLADAWAIAIGQTDCVSLTGELFRRYGHELIHIADALAAEKEHRVSSYYNIILGAVMGRIIAHELGHALIAVGFSHPFGADDEAGADYFAAKLDAARGKHGRLGQLIFEAIGCTGPTCDHPSPAGRAHAYATGYNEQLQQAA